MMEENKVEAGGLIYKENVGMVGLINIPIHPGISGRYFSALANAGIHVELIVNLSDGHKFDHLLVCVDRDQIEEALAITWIIHEEVGSQSIIQDSEVSLVCISSLDFDESQVIAGHMFKALGDSGINIIGISTSVSSVTCMISSNDFENALSALRQAFILP